MPDHQMLDNITHKDVRIRTEHNLKLTDSDSYARVFLSELNHVQAEYPVFFRKQSDTGEFELICLFGFDVQENLFLDDNGWHAHYVPLSVQRRPFLIGFQQQGHQSSPVVHIDMQSPRVNQSQGQAVFLPEGGQSPYLQHISGILNSIHQGHQQLPAYVQALLTLELIEPVDLKVTLADNSRQQLGQLYTIHEERLAALSGDDLHSLHKQGYLRAVYLQVASLANLTKLIERKNQRLQTTEALQ